MCIFYAPTAPGHIPRRRKNLAINKILILILILNYTLIKHTFEYYLPFLPIEPTKFYKLDLWVTRSHYLLQTTLSAGTHIWTNSVCSHACFLLVPMLTNWSVHIKQPNTQCFEQASTQSPTLPISSSVRRSPSQIKFIQTPGKAQRLRNKHALTEMSYGKAETYRPVPRDFSTLIQTCSSNIQKITQNTAQIKIMVNQLGTRQDTSELQDRLQQIQHYTNQLAKETNKHLKELGSIPLASSPSEQRQQKIQKDRLMNDFSAALNNFQAVQRRAAEKEKESVARARAGSRLSTEDSSRDEKLVSFDNQEDWGQITTQTEEVAITEEDLELIKERETNIRQLESDIMDVNQIFKDLAVMIHDQGEMIDSIEANVENAEVHVERGTEQLQRAAYYQQKSRKKMCILAMYLLGITRTTK
uniref:Syntaxin-12 n=1 Tax=Dicentrarchus labrax TaxID=13489 RepID=A0A8P4KF72_DICLA